jgi:hypothetical protein
VLEWLDEHADDPQAAELRVQNEQFQRTYLEWNRELLGWAIFAGRKLMQ